MVYQRVPKRIAFTKTEPLQYPDSLQALGINNLAVLTIGLYLGQVVHAVATDHNQVRAILVERASLEAAVVRVGYFEPSETPLAAEVVADAFHEGQFRLLILRSICVIGVLALCCDLLTIGSTVDCVGALLLYVGDLHAT